MLASTNFCVSNVVVEHGPAHVKVGIQRVSCEHALGVKAGGHALRTQRTPLVDHRAIHIGPDPGQPNLDLSTAFTSIALPNRTHHLCQVSSALRYPPYAPVQHAARIPELVSTVKFTGKHTHSPRRLSALVARHRPAQVHQCAALRLGHCI
jgi:hypothetical protein